MKDKHLHEEGEGHEEEEVPEQDERQPLLILPRAPYLLEDHFEVLAGTHLSSHDNYGFRRNGVNLSSRGAICNLADKWVNLEVGMARTAAIVLLMITLAGQFHKCLHATP